MSHPSHCRTFANLLLDKMASKRKFLSPIATIQQSRPRSCVCSFAHHEHPCGLHDIRHFTINHCSPLIARNQLSTFTL